MFKLRAGNPIDPAAEKTVIRANLLRRAVGGNHPAFFHHPAGSIVSKLMHGDDLFAADLVKEKAEKFTGRFGGVSFSPPVFPETIPDLENQLFAADFGRAAGADRFGAPFWDDRPFVKILPAVLLLPVKENVFRLGGGDMRPPEKVAGDFRVGRPIVKHRLFILYGKGTEQKPIG